MMLPGLVAWVLGGAATQLLPHAAAQAEKPKAPPTATLTAPAMIAAPPPADFKLSIAFYGVRKEPITTAELVVHSGIAYHFARDEPGEVVMFDPSAARLELLDLDRGVQSEIMLTKLDEKVAVLHRAITEAIRKHEEAGTRADRVSAEMSRALIEPKLAETNDPASDHLRLTNSVVTVDATGEPESQVVRLALIDSTLTGLIKLAAVRDPKAIPPFVRLDALHILTGGKHLRPTEMSFLYRLAGPPRKHRWTYRLVNS